MRISDWSSDVCSSDLKVGAVSWPLIIKGLLTLRDSKTYLFFTASANGRRAAKAFLARLKERKADRDATVSITAFRRQLTAIQAWGKQAPQNLGAIHQPVLVANGDQIGRASCRDRWCQYV